MPGSLSEIMPVVVKLQYGGSNIMVKQFYLGKWLKPGCSILMALYNNFLKTAFNFLEVLKNQWLFKKLLRQTQPKFCSFTSGDVWWTCNFIASSVYSHNELRRTLKSWLNSWVVSWPLRLGLLYEIFSDSQCLQARKTTICLCPCLCHTFNYVLLLVDTA